MSKINGVQYGRIKYVRSLAGVLVLIYVLFLFFWYIIVHTAPIGIVDSIHSVQDSNFSDLAPWRYPDSQTPFRLSGMDINEYQYRRGTLVTRFYIVNFFQILPNDDPRPKLIERYSTFTLRVWPSLQGPIIATLLLVLLLSILYCQRRNCKNSIGRSD